MRRTLFILISFLLWIQAGITFASELPSIDHYFLHLHIFPNEQRFEAEAKMTITNRTEKTCSEIPLLLYRLLDVQESRDEKGLPLNFSQSIVKLEDVNSWQVNLVKIGLQAPLAPATSTDITVKYGGSLFGYPEVMPYVQDRIDEHFSLVRPDALAYPLLSYPSMQSLMSGHQSEFTYELEVTVPSVYVVASGGIFKDTVSLADSKTFIYQSRRPTQRIDVAIAPFKLLKDERHQLSVYTLPEDEAGAPNVLNSVERVINLYSNLFGEIKDYHGYTIIEIPDGWGSQAGDGYFLQAAKPFRGQNLSEVYHEISHTWNVKAKPEVERCRWFDEAFAMYFEALAVREFEGQTAFQHHMARLRETFVKRAEKDKRVFETPIAEYGKQELGRTSYTKGAWSLYVLHQLVGEELFKQIIRTFLSEYAEKPADFHDFQSLAERVSKKDLSKFFDEWIFGSESSRLLKEKIPLDEIVKRYR